MHFTEFEIKDMTESNRSASYVNFLVSTREAVNFLYDIRYEFHFFCSWTAIFNLRRVKAFFFNLIADTIRQGLLLLRMFYYEGDAIFQYAHQAEMSMNN